MGYGIAIGVIGGLIGAVLALWWKAKYNAAKGTAEKLMLKLQYEEGDHQETLKQLGALANEYKEDNEKKEKLINDYKTRWEAAEKRHLETASDADLLALANSLRRNKGSGEVARPSGGGPGKVVPN